MYRPTSMSRPKPKLVEQDRGSILLAEIEVQKSRKVKTTVILQSGRERACWERAELRRQITEGGMQRKGG